MAVRVQYMEPGFLMCDSVGSVQRAFQDEHLLSDCRVLDNLLADEERFLLRSSYFSCVQQDIQPWMRNRVATWMMEVCQEQRCEEDVFLLALNYLDRFLSKVRVKRSSLQLLGGVCMFLASKLKETVSLTAEKVILYTDNSVGLDEFLECELLVLDSLRWNMGTVTTLDFLDQLLYRLPCTPGQTRLLRKLSHSTVQLCMASDVKFSLYPPSMLTAAAILLNMQRHLQGEICTNRDFMLTKLEQITAIDGDCLLSCEEQMKKALEKQNTQSRDDTAPNHKTETPTDIRDISIS